MATKNNVINIDLSSTSKKKVIFDNDEDRAVYLDLADMSITTRLSAVEPKLNELSEKFGKVKDGESSMSEISETLSEIDKEMRDLIDYLFDAPVSAVAAPSGSMFDMFNGEFRCSIIMSALLEQYTANVEKETAILDKQMRKHTDKYTKGTK